MCYCASPSVCAVSFLMSLLLSVHLASCPAPTRLVVIQHGLYGDAVNMHVLRTQIESAASGDTLVHLASSNEGLTRDGIAAGGRRLAAEVRRVAAQQPTLQTLSLVGNSLGGLYARYAASELLDSGGLMAGLTPDALCTIGSPHLGVRRYTYLPVPSLLRQQLGPIVAGRTADELLLQDGDHRYVNERSTDERYTDKGQTPSRSTPNRASTRGGLGGGLVDDAGDELLLRMSTGARHLAALRAFRRRRLYANLFGDFMVPCGTAAILGEGGGTGRRWGAGIGDASKERAAELMRRCDRRSRAFVDEAVLRGEASGIGLVYEEPRSDEMGTGGDVEAAMSRALNACGWSKVFCAWQSAAILPLAHNKLPALRREGWRRGFEVIERAGEGRVVMEHASRFLLEEG